MANAYTVLVIGDEPPILRFLRTSLCAAGHRVVTAESADHALSALAVETPDVVILDPSCAATFRSILSATSPAPAGKSSSRQNRRQLPPDQRVWSLAIWCSTDELPR